MSQPLLRIHLCGRYRVAGRGGSDKAKIQLSAREAGQIIVIFALMLTVLIGLVGIAIDVTYAWRQGLDIQRAADAGALAGVVYLPGDTTTAHDRAIAEVGRNGYSANATTTVTAAPNPSDGRQLDVSVTAQAPTFFVRLFGIDHWTITRNARAAFVMPVPMGSPLNYFGVGCLVRSGVTPVPACASAGTGASGVTTSGTSGGTSLGSLGAWGAVITKGGNEENGDAYSPANNTIGTTWPVDVSNNVLYNPNGYYYTAVLPAGGNIQIFDPGFCENKKNGSNGYYGTGDQWPLLPANPVSTYYRVLNTHGQPLNPLAWNTTGGVDWNTTFVGQHGTDGGPYGSGACDAFHNKWWTLASGLGVGTYEVQVSTTDPNSSATNTNVNAENMFAIMVPSGGAVYGYDKMAVYNNLSGNGVLQQFYIAQVDKTTGAGKTLTIDLFDIGDSTGGTIKILSPDGNKQTAINFNYTTFNYLNASMVRVGPPGNCKSGVSDLCVDNNVSSITVANGSNQSSFNNTWIEITIPLGTNYGANGLWQNGWWQVQYNVTAGNDLTTWSVNVNGNPVHLVPVP